MDDTHPDDDSNLPDYGTILDCLDKAPDTWLPGLLRRIVTLCVKRCVFSTGGLERHVLSAKQSVSPDPLRASP